ncbi:MAG TPA: prepilin-type N-terminal cleavage/methylation domain-containing protein [Cellvibrionaceae bacterium]
MRKNQFTKNQQSGFTLVEIAIVLVIIGLLLGGVLKGTELIENSKVKRAVSEINGVTAALYSYQDRYQRLPGDDGPIATLRARGGPWATGVTAGTNNGVIVAAAADTFVPVAEGLSFWQHLKAAGFINGNPTDTGANALPRNAFGGVIGLTTTAVGASAASQISGRIICLSQVPGKAAAALDTQLDDGNGNAGRMRAFLGTAGNNTPPAANTPLAAPYSEVAEYTICSQM